MNITDLTLNWIGAGNNPLRKYKTLRLCLKIMAWVAVISAMASIALPLLMKGKSGLVANLVEALSVDALFCIFIWSLMLSFVCIGLVFWLGLLRDGTYLDSLKNGLQKDLDVPDTLLTMIAKSESLSDEAKIMVGNAMDGKSAFTFGELFAIEESINNISGRDMLATYSNNAKR